MTLEKASFDARHASTVVPGTSFYVCRGPDGEWFHVSEGAYSRAPGRTIGEYAEIWLDGTCVDHARRDP